MQHTRCHLLWTTIPAVFCRKWGKWQTL